MILVFAAVVWLLVDLLAAAAVALFTLALLGRQR